MVVVEKKLKQISLLRDLSGQSSDCALLRGR